MGSPLRVRMTLNHQNDDIIMFLDPQNIGHDILLTNLLILVFRQEGTKLFE